MIQNVSETPKRNTPRNRLKSLREAQGLDRKGLASIIVSRDGGERGAQREHVSDRTVGRWETGEVAIPQRYWAELAGIFRVSEAHLLGLDGLDGEHDDGIRRVA